MTTAETAPSKPTKPAAKQPSALEEGAMRVRALLFRTHVPLPFGLEEQQVMRISEVASSVNKTRFQILFLPRIDKYLVRAWVTQDNGPPSHTFLVPAEWAIAEMGDA